MPDMSRHSLPILLGLALASASCGDNASATDDASEDAAAASTCRAAFFGNFGEVSQGGSACATISTDRASGDIVLGFHVPTMTLDAPLVLAIDLGTSPSRGAYSPAIVQMWSAVATSSVNSACVYSAGTSAVPSGTFTLMLDAIDIEARIAHGVLTLNSYVHAFVMTDCGPSPTEAVTIRF